MHWGLNADASAALVLSEYHCRVEACSQLLSHCLCLDSLVEDVQVSLRILLEAGALLVRKLQLFSQRLGKLHFIVIWYPKPKERLKSCICMASDTRRQEMASLVQIWTKRMQECAIRFWILESVVRSIICKASQ